MSGAGPAPWWVAGGVLLAGVAGCGAAAGGHAAAGTDAASGMPPVQVDQVVELLADGKNQRRQAYQDALQACQQAGFPTRPLADADVARIGTSRYRLWFAANLEAIRREDWDFDLPGAAGTCQFELKYSGTQDTWKQGQHLAVDLATGESNSDLLQADALVRFPAEAASGPAEPDVSGPANRAVAGQPCKEWTDQTLNTRQCVWSGGTRWGFSDAPSHGYQASRDFIILEEEPLAGNGTRVKTQVMSAGKAWDPAQLEPAHPKAGKISGGQP